MVLTRKDFDYLWITGSRWAGCKGTEDWINEGAYETLDDAPVRRDLKSHFIFKDYASLLWARQYLEQERIDFQVLTNEFDSEGEMPWSIIADLSLGENFDQPCQCKRCKKARKLLRQD